MDLVFTRRELLDVALEEDVLGGPVEAAWREHLRPIARRALVTAGVDDRTPFNLLEDGSIDDRLVEVFRTFAGQTPGRTTMASYAPHVVRLLRYLAEQGLDLKTVTPAQLANYRRLRNRSGIQPISWNSEAAALKSFFDAVVLAGRRPDNPCTFPTLVWSNKRAARARAPDFITLAQFERFKNEGLATGRYALRNAAFADLILTSAMRLEEASGFLKASVPSHKQLRALPSKSLRYVGSGPIDVRIAI